jgi:hypothetical protein
LALISEKLLVHPWIGWPATAVPLIASTATTAASKAPNKTLCRI